MQRYRAGALDEDQLDRTVDLGVMNLHLTGQSVHTVALDYAVTLRLDGGAEIRIECAFSLRLPNGRLELIDPEHLGPGLAHIVYVLHQTVTEAVAHDTGLLVLDFDNAARLEVAPDKSYEAWAVSGPRGEKVIAMPGGELAIWGPRPDPGSVGVSDG